MNTPLFWVLVWFLRCVFGFLRAEKAKKKSRKRVARVSSGLALSFSLLALAAALGNSSRRPARAGRECQSCARKSDPPPPLTPPYVVSVRVGAPTCGAVCHVQYLHFPTTTRGLGRENLFSSGHLIKKPRGGVRAGQENC